MDDIAEREPLAERLPNYLKTFGIGLGVSAVLGIVGGLITSTNILVAYGNVLMALGVVYLLTGGARGGGYTNMGAGAAAALFGGRNRVDEDVDDEDVRMGGTTKGMYTERKSHDPMARLRKGLRPSANPSAFWQVIGGFSYLGFGLVMLARFG